MGKLYKGLTKLFIKESKNKELGFEKKQLESIKASAEVKLYKKDNDSGWKLYVWSQYDEGCCGCGYYWRGCFDWDEDKNEGKMNIFCGFSGNPICTIDRNYTCTRHFGTDYKKEFQTILEYMKKARISHIGNMEGYKEYVQRTGDMT